MKKSFILFLSYFLTFNFIHAQIGKVGINTLTPQAMLHVKDSSVLFTGTSDVPNGLGAPPASGAGVRMMWYPAKAAFRAGFVSGTNWNKDSIGLYSLATGFNTKASGNRSTAMGFGTIASGVVSTAMGRFTTASGEGSTSMGEYTMAFGVLSTAMGTGTTASGTSSTAMGESTTASGTTSTAMGKSTTASGSRSTAMGISTTAKPFASLVIGRFNDTTSISSSTWNDLDPVFIIGNGSSDNSRSNAMTVLKNGKTGINVENPQALLHIIGNGTSGGPFNSNSLAILESNTSSYIQFSQAINTESGLLAGGPATSIRSALIFKQDSSVQIRSGGNNTRITVDKNGDVGIGTSTPSFHLHVSTNDAGKPTSNVWTVASDARLKKDIHDYQDGLDKLLQIHPVWFTYTGEADMPHDTGVGVLAQELKEIAPYMVGTWNYKDEDGKSTPYLSVNNGSMTYMMINAIKEQQEIINHHQKIMNDQAGAIAAQQQQIDFLLKELNEIKKLVSSTRESK